MYSFPSLFIMEYLCPVPLFIILPFISYGVLFSVILFMLLIVPLVLVFLPCRDAIFSTSF